MRFILEYNEVKKTRCKDLTPNEFLDIFFKECNNFSFDNDQLWRSKSVNNSLQLFKESTRKDTFGNFDWYKNFFELRRGYPVPRYRSLIGSTTEIGAKSLSSTNEQQTIIIPFDGSNIVFSSVCDVLVYNKKGISMSDDLFIMKTYDKNFKVPKSELDSINLNLKDINDSHIKSIIKSTDKYGFEFFTNANCLILPKSEIEWLKGVMNC